jgi:phosphoribosylanthranilate isomerase
MWIKICGNTSLEDAQFAAGSGADAVGFIFAPSPRQCTPEQVAEIAPHLPAELEKIGVFVDASFTEIASIVELCGLTGVQLHSVAQHTVAARLRERFGSPLRILQVIHFGETAADGLHHASSDPNLDGVLIDSRTATAVGGTGIAFDWQAAREQIFGSRQALKLIAAGGLNPGNIAEAIATLQPWGVDAVTGVEAAPGRKDPKKVRAFVTRARLAAAQLPAQSVH